MSATVGGWRDWAVSKGAGPLLVVLVAVAFGASLAGPPFWDDTKLLAAADSLAHFGDAFRAHSFGLRDFAHGRGASFWRPLVTASLWSEGRVAARLGVDANVLRHLVQCLWHAAGAWLVWRLLRRLAPSELPSWWNTAAWWAALAWAVVPLKVENVTWLSGLGDVMGWTLLLLGAELALRLRHSAWRVLIAALATGLALLCKEVWIVAPLLWGLLVRERGQTSKRPLAQPELWGSLASAALYVVVRAAIIGGARGGGGEMFARLGPLERATMPFETFGHAMLALITPWAPRLLRGPWAFEGGQLAPEDLAGGVGLVTLLVAGVVWLKAERFRAPLLLLVVPLLPVLNVVPTGLEARMSDRYLYVPFLGVLLGLLLAVSPSPPAWLAAIAARWRLFALPLALLLLLAPQYRIRQFTHPILLWAAEFEHPGAAVSIAVHYAHALENAGQLRPARNVFLFAADRYSKMGFAEGLPLVITAIRLETLAAGETAAAKRAYANALRCIRAGNPEFVGVPFADGGGVRVPCQSVEAEVVRTNQAALLNSELARLEQRPR